MSTVRVSAATRQPTTALSKLQPLAAVLLSGGLVVPGFVQAQSSAQAAAAPTAAPAPAPAKAEAEVTLNPVTVRDLREQEGKDSIKARNTTSAKGNQALRDVPQSVTVVTEKLIDDRNLDTLKEVLHNTAGVTFLAAEGGEEDIRLRGFSLANTGDIYLDGMRDPAFYERDTFAFDRVDLLRGSASMLFGRGSTGGVANQVTKLPHTYADNELTASVGTGGYKRVTADVNSRIGSNSAIRLNAMHTTAQNDGRGNGLDKTGVAAAVRIGIGERHEFNANIYSLQNRNPRMNYGLPWLPDTVPATATTPRGLIEGLAPNAYLGMDSDRNASGANVFTASHTWRIDTGKELKTQLRKGSYTRDQRASAIRFASGATTSALTVNDNTLFTRGTNLKVQDMQVSQIQSDLNWAFQALGYKNELLAGIDLTREAKQVFAARSAAQGGVNLTKPSISLGGIAQGTNWVDEDSRIQRLGNEFVARGTGVYAQNTLHLTPQWKLIAGLRHDSMRGDFAQYAIPAAAAGPVTTTPFAQSISEVSKRLGALWQPDERRSFHFSYGTSFNTSGDTYSYNSTNANVPPEQSRNLELGAKIDSADKLWSTRYAVFYAEKYNERNTDADTAATSLLLSGKRHSAGVEFDISGRIGKQWEVFGSYMWIPNAKVDRAAACPATGACLQSQPGEAVGQRPGLIPLHSGTAWATYQYTPKWRVGGGLNFRSTQKPVQSVIQAPGYETADLLLEYRFSDSVTVKTNLNNISNKLYADTLYRGHYLPGQGRTLVATLTSRF